MSREQYIKALIKSKGMTIKEFAQFIQMPYSTLLSMLNGSIGGAAVDNVLKICRGLNISVSNLQEHDDKEKKEYSLDLTDLEAQVVHQFREHPEMRQAVCKLLDIADEQDS